MARPSVDTAALQKLITIFSVETRKRILARAGKRMGVAAEAVVPEYPVASGKPLPKIYTRTRPDGSTYLSKFKNAAMQGAVFAKIKAGAIPYVRTGTLGRSITSGIADLTGESVTVKIGTAIAYAPLVIGNDSEQATYFKGVWWQLDKVMAEHTAEIESEGQQALADAVAAELKV